MTRELAEHKEYAIEIAEEEKRVERLMRVEEIWSAGFLYGLAYAGLRENPELEYKNWLLERAL